MNYVHLSTMPYVCSLLLVFIFMFSVYFEKTRPQKVNNQNGFQKIALNSKGEEYRFLICKNKKNGYRIYIEEIPTILSSSGKAKVSTDGSGRTFLAVDCKNKEEIDEEIDEFIHEQED